MASELSNTHSPPLVSVIVPAYNYGRFIGETLLSVQAQTYTRWECLVIDDGSIDDTTEIVNAFARQDARIKYLYQKNQGPSAARNNGIKNSCGAYVQFLDADDLIEADKLARHVEYLEQHKEADIVYSAARYFSSDKINERQYSMREVDEAWMPEASGDGKRILAFLARGNIMAIQCPLLRKSIVDAVGLFDEMLPPLEDWDYWIRCAAQGKCFRYANIKNTLALVRTHPSSLSRNNDGMITAALQLQNKLKSAAVDADVASLYKKLVAHLEASLGIEETKRGNRLRGAQRLFSAGIMSGKIKLFAYALAALCVSRQRFEQITAFSINRLVAGLRQSSATFFS